MDDPRRPGRTPLVTLAVQAGGRSSRMGRDKGLVLLAGKPLVQHVLERLSVLAGDVVITTNHPQDYAGLGARTVPDRDPGAGALSGLLTALTAARGDPVLVAACDMPFTSPSLAAHLLGLASQADAVIPRRDGEYEPLFAVYRRTCIPAIERALSRGDRRVISFFPEVAVRILEQDEILTIEPDVWSFFNVNTEADLAEAERRLAAAEPRRRT